jgi:hypothetical protein
MDHSIYLRTQRTSADCCEDIGSGSRTAIVDRLDVDRFPAINGRLMSG